MLLSNLFEAPKLTPEDKAWIAKIRDNSFMAVDGIVAAIKKGQPVSRAVIEALVTEHGAHIREIPKPDERLQALAVKSYPAAIQYIENPSEAIKLLAVKTNFEAISYIENPSEAIQIAAIEGHPYAIRRLENPSPKAQALALATEPGTFEAINNPSEEACLTAATTLGPIGLRFIYDKDIEIKPEWLAASIKTDPSGTVKMFRYMDEDMQWLAYRTDPRSFKYLFGLKNLSREIEKAHDQYLRKKDRERNMPLVGQRRPGTQDYSPDQLRLLRWFEQNGRDSITVKELKAQSWGNAPYLAGLVRAKGGRDITKADVIGTAPPSEPSSAKALMQAAQVSVMPWTGQQRIFDDRPNRAAVFHVTGASFEEIVLKDADPEVQRVVDAVKAILATVRRSGEHPNPPRTDKGLFREFIFKDIEKFEPNNRYTIGWVRFTVFGKDIWIDEVQSDLRKMLPPQLHGKIKGLTEILLLEFLRRMRRRGAGRFFMPSHEMKLDKEMYDANSPENVYQDLPKKMRFRKATVAGIDPKVDGKEAWLLEGVQAKRNLNAIAVR